ncbi:uncharacterized protein LOC115626267 [Scaptodrosophila lebanonensis]|uniref:Uncharacterized protein LOC115626267 n=1 Tax=Drosophila lebanonensis TaxID=7225 RepID=A0A6J2TN23_DROLE|nr:uncharacterized protein LOC115626267 [Scaptodrosophila lebanonensis]
MSHVRPSDRCVKARPRSRLPKLCCVECLCEVLNLMPRHECRCSRQDIGMQEKSQSKVKAQADKRTHPLKTRSKIQPSVLSTYKSVIAHLRKQKREAKKVRGINGGKGPKRATKK